MKNLVLIEIILFMKEQCFLTGIVGTGRIGFSLGFDKKREQPASHTMALFNNKNIRLIAAADSNEENLAAWKKYARKYARKKKSMALTFSSSRELYENVTCLDIIVVAVNEESHLEECLKAIEYKPRLVILEKPVALNSAQAALILDAAKKAEVPVMVNHERRFALDYRMAKELLSQIGEIQYVDARLNSGLRVWAEEFEKDGTYSLLHDGTHLVDIVRFLFDVELKDPLVTGIYRDEKNIVRNFTAVYHTDRISQILISMSGRSKFFEFSIEVTGTLGRLCIGNGFFKLYKREESRLYTGFYSLAKQKLRVPKKTGYFANMVQNAVDFLRVGAPLESPLEQAVEDLKVLEEIKEAFK